MPGSTWLLNNKRSDGVDEAGIARYFGANFATIVGNCVRYMLRKK